MTHAGQILLCLLACVAAQAHGEAAPLQLLALDSALDSAVPATVERFATDAVTLRAVILKNRETPANIACDVLGDGDALATPLAKNVPFVAAAQVPGSALLDGTFTLHLPQLNKVKLRVLIYTPLPEGKAQVIARLVMWITPKDALREGLTRWVNKHSPSDRPRLLVFGPKTGLRELMRSWRISFAEGGAELPTRIEAGVLAVGDADDLSHPPALAPKSSLLVFHPDPPDGVDVSVKLTTQSCFTIVRQPAVNLWSASPFLHRQFIAQIQRHLDLHE